jgi:phospholipase C
LTQCLSTTNRRREFIADPESVDFPIFFIHFDMQKLDRRQFLRSSASAVGSVAMLAALPASIQRALAIPAHNKSGTIDDIQHIVVLMQENRSFDHYFGTLRGVRGYGDRFPIPLASGKSVWYQSDGTKEITPFRFDKNTMNAALIPDMPHNFPDAQAAWNQGSYGYWPKYKSATSMGYYTREEAPFQYALAEAFTICDAYHCSVTTGTDPNRIAFFSGSNNNPALRNQGINCTDADAEPVNLRCWITGTWPTPGYTYAGSGFNWPTLPDVLESAGISWRIYQDPNNNWTGAMNGCLAFNSFRNAKPGSPIYEKGMSNWSLDDLANDVRNGTLPSVSWVLPSQLESEHPGAPSSAAHGGYFVEQVLQALTSNPDTWSKTAFFLTFDENDGLFDHVPPPAVPSYNPDGSLAGKSTMDVNGMYFAVNKPSYLLAADTASGNIRPWGMGARVPMYVVSPWSKGGFVNSQVFDHASLGLFLEKRFNVTIPAISKWHRAVSGDLTSAFDFSHPNDAKFPSMPDMSDWAQIEAQSKALPTATAPATPAALFQEPGTRYSRALPYELHASAAVQPNGAVKLTFQNTGSQGAVFHVYDKNHLDRIPRRYTVEAGMELSDGYWNPMATDNGAYDLWVYGPNGFVRTFKGNVKVPVAEIEVVYDADKTAVSINAHNSGRDAVNLTVVANAYRQGGPWILRVPGGVTVEQRWDIAGNGNWYDFTVSGENFERRFAGRLENGRASLSDPAMGLSQHHDGQGNGDD